MKRFLISALISVGVLVVAFGLAITLGGPGEPPPPMPSISDPFKNVDFSDLPERKAWITKGLTKRWSETPPGYEPVIGYQLLVSVRELPFDGRSSAC